MQSVKVRDIVFLCFVQIDYLLIGQGISGTMLSHHLMDAGLKVLVIDEWNEATASRVASGIINPVTGRKITRTWLIEELLPYAEEAYAAIGQKVGKVVARDIELLTFHATEQMAQAWHERICEGEDYLRHITDTSAYSQHFEIRNGLGATSPAMLIDLPILLPAWRQYLKDNGCLRDEVFDMSRCEVTEQSVTYKDIKAKGLIFCNGIHAYDNPYFARLPHAPSKGEALTVRIPELPQTNIYKQGMTLVPLGGDYFWVGSTFEWKFTDAGPTEAFIKKVTNALDGWLKLPYTIEEHKAAIRPASLERRPFVGMHPEITNVGIFSGMGTKGCSLSPYFARQFACFLTGKGDINPYADVRRFSKITRR